MTTHPLRILVALMLSLLVTLFCVAQPKANLAQLQKTYPNDEMAYLNWNETVSIEASNGVIDIRSQHQKDRIFLSNRASLMADERIYFSDSFQEIADLKAVSYVPDKNTYRSIPVTDIKTERPSPGGGIFFDDSQVKKFVFPSAKVGGIGTLTYTERLKNPFMLTGFVFGNYVPVINTSFSVSFPTAVKVSYKTFGDMKGIVFKQTTQNGKTTYTWSAQHLKPYPIETESLSLRHYAPQVFLFIESYTLNGQTTQVLGDVPKLFNYYQSLVKNLNQKPDPALKALADSLTRGKSDLDKIKSVYYWVQDHIKYIAFEEGLGGFVPRQAADVCQKRYGDCKDMASLTTALLRLAGIPAYLTWIGTRDIPYRYAQNPSMSVDNHMIAAVKWNNQWQFLDATDDRIDFGLPTSHIQGKEAMIMVADNRYEIVEVPTVIASQNSKKDSISLNFEGRTINGKGTMTFGGLWKTQLKSLVQYRSEAQRNEYYKGILSRGSNKSSLVQQQVKGLSERDAPLQFDYVFQVPDYVQEAAGEVFVNLHLSRPWADRAQENRKNDWKREFTTQEELITTLPIPSGYEVTYVPQNAQFSHPQFGFEIRYEQKDGKLVMRNRVTIDTLLIKKADFDAWNKMIAALNDAYSEVVSLKKSANSK